MVPTIYRIHDSIFAFASGITTRNRDNGSELCMIDGNGNGNKGTNEGRCMTNFYGQHYTYIYLV